MPLITAANVAKSYGPVDIFKDIHLSLPAHARAAIVGPNGIGKTTLLRILAGIDPPTSGQVILARGVRLGYLPQEATFISSELTLWQECLESFADLRSLEAVLVQMEAQMADPVQAESILERYGALQSEFDRRGGYVYISRIRQVLTGLGFSADEFEMPMTHLSGGQRTRALLARLLLSEPDLLILDEPTNHLDIQAVEWLEGYLSQWEGAALIVSHDRYFLDRVTTIIYEMSRAGFETYRGNYTAYLNQRQERWNRRREIFDRERERLFKEVEYIKRNISGQNVSQAKGRLRRLSRILQAVEQVGMEATLSKSWAELSEDVRVATSPLSPEEAEHRLRALTPPSNRPLELHFKLKPDFRSGDIVLRAYDLQIGYPGNALFAVQELELRRLECAALIGPNGAGKSTFLKTILGELEPLQGEVVLGASLQIGYFAQAHENLNPERTPVQEIDAVAPHLLLAEIRDYLAKYLFSGEDVFKKVAVLSGGERGRLALAKLALSNANLLLLDEPTNHLDIPAQEVLQEVLANFQGTILLVSHDRYLIDALATQIWEIDDQEASLSIFKGTYSEQRQYLESQRLAEASQTVTEIDRTASGRKGAMSISEAALHSGLSRNEERRRQARLDEVEAQITRLENQLADLSRQLENPPANSEKVQQIGSDYVRLQQELDRLYLDWEEIQASLLEHNVKTLRK
jgi:ATP-binding cassette, subfamily F, member 3